MSLLALFLIALGPFLVVSPMAFATMWQIPECLRPAGNPPRPVARPRWAAA
jgi:hypothetical protein